MTIKQVCEMLDAEVINDLDAFDNVVYFIGIRPEYSAGLLGDVYTPHFHALKELEQYCQENEDVLEQLATELF